MGTIVEAPTRRAIATVEGGALPISARLQPYLIAYDDGEVLVAGDQSADPEYVSMIERASAIGLRLRPARSVSVTEIAAAYAGGVDANALATEARADFIRLIKRAAEIRASDMLMIRRGGSATVCYRVAGAYALPEREFDAARAATLFNAAFNLADTGDTIAAASKPIQAAITNARVLPEGVNGLRLQMTPTANGFSLTARLIYSAEAIEIGSFEQAGFAKAEIAILHEAASSVGGVIIVAGPTEHGKSTTLDLALSEFARSFPAFPNVIEVADPPESAHLPFVQAFSINKSISSAEHAFEEALMSARRMAPDALKIGEIREAVSARAAFTAAGAGALVFTTLHASLATDIPYQLRDLGLEEHRAFGSANRLWMTQRLLPLICRDCAVPALEVASPERRALLDVFSKLPAVETDALAKIVFTGPGCDACARTPGRRGRMLVTEMMAPEAGTCDAMRCLTKTEARAAAIGAGMVPIAAPAMEAVLTQRVGLDAMVRVVAPPAVLIADLKAWLAFEEAA